MFFRSSTWINVDINSPINLQTYNCCMMLADIHGDNDNKFVVVDFGLGVSSPQLKVRTFEMILRGKKCTRLFACFMQYAKIVLNFNRFLKD